MFKTLLFLLASALSFLGFQIKPAPSPAPVIESIPTSSEPALNLPALEPAAPVLALPSEAAPRAPSEIVITIPRVTSTASASSTPQIASTTEIQAESAELVPLPPPATSTPFEDLLRFQADRKLEMSGKPLSGEVLAQTKPKAVCGEDNFLRWEGQVAPRLFTASLSPAGAIRIDIPQHVSNPAKWPVEYAVVYWISDIINTTVGLAEARTPSLPVDLVLPADYSGHNVAFQLSIRYECAASEGFASMGIKPDLSIVRLEL